MIRFHIWHFPRVPPFLSPPLVCASHKVDNLTPFRWAFSVQTALSTRPQRPGVSLDGRPVDRQPRLLLILARSDTGRPVRYGPTSSNLRGKTCYLPFTPPLLNNSPILPPQPGAVGQAIQQYGLVYCGEMSSEGQRGWGWWGDC